MTTGSQNNESKPLEGSWIVALTGASGVRYGIRLIDVLSMTLQTVHVVFSEAALRVLAEEEGQKISATRLSAAELLGREQENIEFYRPRDIGAAIASGSMPVDGMVICPCSMNTLAAVASGISENLIQRAADVTMKEGRKLLIVPRETPLSQIHLENMLRLSRAGAAVIPAMPGFYHEPSTIDDLVDMMVMKITDQMGLQLDLVPRWNPGSKAERYLGKGAESLTMEARRNG
jgi:4-hydroxy-3-polyprenylbenzoate decarboxylase